MEQGKLGRLVAGHGVQVIHAYQGELLEVADGLDHAGGAEFAQRQAGAAQPVRLRRRERGVQQMRLAARGRSPQEQRRALAAGGQALRQLAGARAAPAGRADEALEGLVRPQAQFERLLGAQHGGSWAYHALSR